ncbi:MAG: hypothetical protein JRH20_20810 [Deltaproteobacteria bacterium]|nr:hypothetical protein [Deltaproteobacteria bacterium]
MSYPLPLDAGDIGPDSADDTDAQGESSPTDMGTPTDAGPTDAGGPTDTSSSE